MVKIKANEPISAIQKYEVTKPHREKKCDRENKRRRSIAGWGNVRLSQRSQ
jgi:hypothetical protein